jgi:hypothetical protein
MLKQKLIKFLKEILLGLGFVFMISPFVLYWFIHGNYDRSIWIISGPYPFNSFGGGPFQMFMYAGLFLFGLILNFISRTLKE